MAFNCRPTRLTGTYHKGPLSLSHEGIVVSADNIVVTAYKRAEDGGAAVLRCYESHGVATLVQFELSSPRRVWSAAVKPYSVETFLVPDDESMPVRCVSLTEL
jgi:alpha-mannosidase